MVPPRDRRFGGSLLGPPDRLPEDDPPDVAAKPVVEPSAGEQSAAAASPRGRQGPPATLRVNETAGTSLWEGYLAAKALDPFLSFRSYTSQIVLLGRAAEDRKSDPERP